MIILALDALDHDLVERYRCKNLMQREHGRTDLSDFELPRTVVLWASFLTGRNMERAIPVETQWEFTLSPGETFLRFFASPAAVDLPALTLKQENHARERALLRKFFHQEAPVEEYEGAVWRNHEENKGEFFALIGRRDLLIGYFDLADAVGHVSFGVPGTMEGIYEELEGIAGEVASSTDEAILIVSDHGMKPIGRYGDHAENGFYSSNRRSGLRIPKITDFYGMMKENAGDEPSPSKPGGHRT